MQVPEDDADTRIKKYLEYYKVMYEGLLPLICAPVVHAFATAKHVKDKAFIPKGDGKVGLNALNKMGKWLIYPENRLAIGLNSHIRNAYAHESYRILDDARLELWDQDPYHPNRSWGPEVWSLDQLAKLCDQLWVNALGITCASAISRSAIASSSLISRRSGLRLTSQPLSSQSFKLIFISNYEYLGATQNIPYEVMVFSNSGAELGNGIDRRVDFTSQGFLGTLERLYYFRKGGIANNEQVYITAVVLFTSRNGAVDEGNNNAVCKGC
jgi:hypothetical protein